MRNYYITAVILFLSAFITAQTVSIPDAAFKARLLAAGPGLDIAYSSSGSTMKIDSNNNQEIEVSEALLVKRLHVEEQDIASMVGLEAFTNLTELWCYDNQLTQLDLSALTLLKGIDCSYNQLTFLNTGTATAIYCDYNQLTSLTIPANGITNLTCSFNQLTSLDVMPAGYVSDFELNNNLFTSFTFSPSVPIYIEGFNLSENLLTDITITNLRCYVLRLDDNQLANIVAIT